MSEYHDDWEYEKEKLDRAAVAELVERHRQEYEEIKGGALTARVVELETQLRRKEETIKACRRQLQKAEADKKRWAQRVADGITARGS